MIVRVRGIKKVRAKGHIYYYHRATNTRIDLPRDTAEFLVEAARLDKLASKKANSSDKKTPSTLGWLIAKYKDPSNPRWNELAERTKDDYQQVFDYLQPLDGMPLAELTAPAIRGIHKKAYQKRKRRFANYVLQVLRLLCNWAIPEGHLTINPTTAVGMIARPKSLPKANRAWSDAECNIVLSEARGGLKVAIALGMIACLRIDKTHQIPWTAYDGTAIAWQHKTDQENWIPVAADLRRILDATQRVATTIVTSTKGRPYRPGGLDKAFHTLILRLEAEGKIAPGLTFHGLRHTAGKNLADLGVDPRTIAAMLGHKSLKMAIHYSEEADRRRRARSAVTALEQDRNRKVENRD